jgi:superfamily II DNA or RNA helicase
MKLRSWQEAHFKAFLEAIGMGIKTFNLEATMGAGKSDLAALLGDEMIENHSHDFVLVVVPWDSIRGNEDSGMVKAFDSRGLRVRVNLFLTGNRASQPSPRRTVFVVTYQSLGQQAIEMLREWKARGLKFTVVFDEIHHTSTAGGQWGEYAGQAHDLADMTITMSGTYFRTDGQRIRFIEYDDRDRPKLSCPGYTYVEAVKDGVCRPVAFRYNDPVIDGHDAKSGEETHVLSSVGADDRRFSAIRKAVLDPNGECVRELIQNVHSYIDATRRKFTDAGFLFTCSPSGTTNEDRYVHQITAKIKEITREEVIEVVSSDPNASGKLERFRCGRMPYLVAINKVSEGVNIPRIRGVGLLRYTDSEMLFRQIVGRSLRMTGDEDGTAACVFLPKFQAMYGFATNMYGESMAGIRDMRCPDCGQYPCVCVCYRCGQSPCVCVGPPPPPPRQEDFVVVNVNPTAGGGSVGYDDVQENFIATAERVKAQCITHRHCNAVQLGHVLQVAGQLTNDAKQAKESPLSELQKIRRNVMRLMGMIVTRAFNGNWSAAWVELMIKRHGVDWKTACVTWPNERLDRFRMELETFLREGVH